MARTVVGLLVLVLVVVTSAERPVNRHRYLLDSASSSSSSTAVAKNNGSASATSSAKSENGTSTATSLASSETREAVERVFAALFKNVTAGNEGKGCNETLDNLFTLIQAEADAVVALYASTFAEVEVDGVGSACADAKSAANTTAEAFGEALTSAIFSAVEDPEARAEVVRMNSTDGALQAFLDAFSSSCTSGGFVSSEQSSFADAVLSVAAETYAWVLGGPACREEAVERVMNLREASGNSTSSSESVSNTLVAGVGTGVAGGTAVAESGSGAPAISSSEAETQSNDPDAIVGASSSASSTGGSSNASAMGSIEIFEEIEDIAIKVVKNVTRMGEGLECGDVLDIAVEEITAQGVAVASIYASAFGEVNVEGEGSACADSSATGDAEAQIFSQIVAQVLVDQLVTGTEKDLTVEDFESIISVRSAKAFADAVAAACSSEGFALAEQVSFASALISPLTEAFALAWGGPSCQDVAQDMTIEPIDESTFVEIESTTIVEMTGEAEATGTVDAVTDVVTDEDDINAAFIDSVTDKCTGMFRFCCMSSARQRDECKCTANADQKFFRCNATAVRSSTRDQLVWKNVDDERACVCA